MRILILGAKGMLGQCLVRAFSDAEVLAWDREELDITNAAQVRERIAAAQPNIVINAAAYNAVDAIEGDPTMAMRVNGEAVGYLAEAVARVGAVFVHYSTDYVFDGLMRTTPSHSPSSRARGSLSRGKVEGEKSTTGYTEDATPHPVSAYGRSKLLGERRLLAVAAQHPGWRWYLVRTSRLFGPAGSSVETKQSFVDAIIAKAATTDRMEVVDEEWSSPTYAVDLVEATRQLVFAGTMGEISRFARNDGQGMPAGIYHRTNDGACTWYGFARAVLDAIEWKGTLVPVLPETYTRAAKRPAYSVLATTRIPPMRQWEEALKEYLEKSEIRMSKSETNTKCG